VSLSCWLATRSQLAVLRADQKQQSVLAKPRPSVAFPRTAKGHYDDRTGNHLLDCTIILLAYYYMIKDKTVKPFL
jgi:hypothetical protein